MKKDGKKILKTVIKVWTFMGMFITSGIVSAIILNVMNYIYYNTNVLDWLLNNDFVSMMFIVGVPQLIMFVTIFGTRTLYKKYITNNS